MSSSAGTRKQVCRYLEVAGALAFFLALVGCSKGIQSTPPGNTCQMNSDCATGLTCSFGRCQSACKEARDCPNDEQCVKDASGINTCLLPAVETCNYSSQCPLPLVCATDLKCRNQCLADRDCATATQKCVQPDGVCAEPSAISANGGLRNSVVGMDAGVPDTAAGSGGSAGSSGSTLDPTAFGGMDAGVPRQSGGVMSAGGSGGNVSPDAGAVTGTSDARRSDGRVDSGGGTSPGTPGVVTFSSGQAQGAMTGYGWVALGASSVITDPTCSGAPITNAAPCMAVTNWDSPTALCMTGTIPAVIAGDYSTNWGAEIGVNANESSGPIGTAYSTIALSVSGYPLTGLRISLHRQGDVASTNYCAPYTASPVRLIDFNTACWDGSGVQFTAADAAKIDQVVLDVPSTQQVITVSKLCLNGITFAGATTPVSPVDAGGGAILTCGDSILEVGEECDDGNTNSGDGCSSTCQIEANYSCPTPGRPCIDQRVCGNGVLTSNEVCDDGNTVSGDGCSGDCQTTEPGYTCPTPGMLCKLFV